MPVAVFESFLAWLRTPLRVRWEWPSRTTPAAGSGVAKVRAVRLLEGGPDLELHNAGPGAAVDPENTAFLLRADDASGEPLARIPVLGTGATYIVTLTASTPLEAADCILRVMWRNRDGSAGRSCWRLTADGRRLTEVPCPWSAAQPWVGAAPFTGVTVGVRWSVRGGGGKGLGSFQRMQWAIPSNCMWPWRLYTQPCWLLGWARF